MTKTLPTKLLRGEVLLGFQALFDDAHGRGDTPWPYPIVTPSTIGPALLPFACPHCGEVRPEIVDPARYKEYRDAARKFSWCPACRCRYYVDRRGMSLAVSLSAGATSAPARVDRLGTAPGEQHGQVVEPVAEQAVEQAVEGRFDLVGAINFVA